MDVDSSIADELGKYGLPVDDYPLMVESLGREPNGLELAIMATMWCEHNSYRHSRPLLDLMFDKVEH